MYHCLSINWSLVVSLFAYSVTSLLSELQCRLSTHIVYGNEMKLAICPHEDDQDTIFLASNSCITELCSLELCGQAVAAVLFLTLRGQAQVLFLLQKLILLNYILYLL